MLRQAPVVSTSFGSPCRLRGMTVVAVVMAKLVARRRRAIAKLVSSTGERRRSLKDAHG